jgi:hypothetical protein
MNTSLKQQYEWMQRNSASIAGPLALLAVWTNLSLESSPMFVVLSVLGGAGSYLHWQGIYLERSSSTVAYALAIGAPVMASNIYGDRPFYATLLTCFSLYLLTLFALIFLTRAATSRGRETLERGASRHEQDRGEA